MLKAYRLLICILIMLPIQLSSQCMVVDTPLQDILNQAALVVEGKVISQQGFYDAEGKNIYTVNEVKVFKKFKGLLISQQIQVVTQGGVVGLEMEKVSNALELEVGKIGLFMLEPAQIGLPVSGVLYKPVQTVLGYLKYDLLTSTALGVFNTYEDIQGELYGLLSTLIQLPVIPISLWDPEDSAIEPTSSVETALASSGGSSSNENYDHHAGVGEVMTITGADFGNEQGQVLFADANSGGTSYIAAYDNQVKVWTNDRIEVEVPYRAGTGLLRVNKADGQTIVSSEQVLIGYNHVNVRFTDEEVTAAYETQLFADNSIDGYEFQFFTDFANNEGASKGFENLMKTWGCNTGVSFKRGENSTIDEDASDGVNIVRFDNGSELGGSVLAYARSRYAGCKQGNTIKWFVYEVEVVMNDDFNWYYGDGLPAQDQFDFETVMLHEIGHAHQLGHVINETEVMHFSVNSGQQKRVLSTIDKIGGEYITEKSTSESICNLPEMEYYDACCYDLMIEEQPISQYVCDETTAINLRYLVTNAVSWQWQIAINEEWVDLNESQEYQGVDSWELTIAGDVKEKNTYRAKAYNACGQLLISNEVIVDPIILDFTFTSVLPTCESMGSINLYRNSFSETVTVNIIGEENTNEIFESSASVLEIPLEEGSYQIIVEHEASGCYVDIGQATLKTPNALDPSIDNVQQPQCNISNGAISLSFSDHPDYEMLQISLDNGESFQSYPDDTNELLIDNLSEGIYNIVVRWENESCATKLPPVELKTPSLPIIAVISTAETCEEPGVITLQREDSSQLLDVIIEGNLANEPWEIGQSIYTINRVSGEYTIAVTDPNTLCSNEFQPVYIAEAVPLVITASVLEQPTCESNTGTIEIGFNDHPEYDMVSISINGGVDYIEFTDQSEVVTINDVPPGNYEIMGQWQDESCTTPLTSLRIENQNFSIGSCISVEEVLGAEGQVTITPEMVYDFASEIGCPKVTLQLNKTNFTCNDLGVNTVELTITDANGAVTTCQPTITITDPGKFCDGIVADVDLETEDTEDFDSTTGEENQNSEEGYKVAVYPNPSSGTIYFQFQEEVAQITLQIFNTTGAMVMEATLTANADDLFQHNIEILPSGLYTLKLTTKNTSFRRSLLVN